MPLTVSGRAAPIGALVLGVSPYRPLNEDYRAFFKLIDRQLRVALTDALAYQNERQRVQLLTDLDLAKMEFFQNVSHELRTPLTLLITPLQDLLAAAPDRAAPEQADLQAAIRAADRLRTMVDALLDFSGAQAGILAPDRQPIDLAGVTAEVASMFRSPAEHAGLHFRVHLPAEPVTALADRAMWSTIVTNLLSNAVKYTPHGGIDIDLRADQATAVLTVTDTGLGIAPEEQTRVFDRFHRAPQVTPGSGAGIGLALVADLVRAHQGTVDLTSAPERGTTLTISIPRGLDTPAATRHTPPAEPTAESTRPRLLLVEDDADLRAYLTRLLTDDGWLVHPVPDAETALAAATDPAGPSTDLVLTDLVLPGHSGLHLVTELRAARRTARLPIVILTGRGGAEAAATGLAAGADDYITKPFSSLELLARVRANHELHQQRETAIGTAEDRANQIRAGLESNRVIGTAIGVVMATYRLTAHQGFQLLVAASQHTNNKLRDIAADVAATGTLALRPTLIDELLIRVHPDHNNDHDHTATRTRPTAGAAADPT
jgi:signal transduction histidine kinase/DNA-binding response OmpR family regulator